MMTSKISIHPLFELVKEISENRGALSQEELDHKWMELYEASLDLQSLCQAFESEFSEIKQRNIELEEKVSLLCKRLDEEMQNMPEKDWVDNEYSCQIKYRKYWDYLDEKSKKFFITANYLYKKMKDIGTGDYSPVVLEFCRAVENELSTGIFLDFIDTFDAPINVESSIPKCYRDLNAAIQNNLNYNNSFISAYSMLGCIGLAPTKTCLYARLLYSFLEDNCWNIPQISDKKFIADSKTFVIDFRGKAAHPNLMNESEAKISRERTDKIVKRFIYARPH